MSCINKGDTRHLLVQCKCKHLILGTQWSVAAVVRRRQLSHVLRDVDVFDLSLTAATNELNERVMYKTILILHSAKHSSGQANRQIINIK